MKLQKLKIYLRQAKNFKKEYPQNFNFWQLVQFFPDWLCSLNEKASPLADQRPWITFSAIQFLSKTLKEDMRVYEYGVGGSTLFFAKRVKEVISVEHDPSWMYQVSEIVNRYGHKNWQGHLIQPRVEPFSLDKDPSDPDAYISSSNCFRGQSFKDYVTSIDEYPNEYFDIVLIDGRARPSCFKHAIPKVKRYGYIMWDNTDRNHYLPVMQTAPKKLEFIDLPGPSPYVSFVTKTSVWYYKGE